MLCEDSGYTFSFQIYTSKGNVAPAVQDLSLPGRVVADLMQPLLNKAGHSRWITSMVNKNRSLSIEFDTNQSTNIGCQ